jgi:hypothetical protein
MTDRPLTPAMDFLVYYLAARENCDFAEACQAANDAGHSISPAAWRHAHRRLGRVAPPALGVPRRKRTRRRHADTAAPVEETAAIAREAPARSGRAQAWTLAVADGASAAALEAIVVAINRGAAAAAVYADGRWSIEIG